MKYGYFTWFQVFLKLPEIIIIGFGDNNVLWPKYIDTYQFWGVAGAYKVHLTFFVYYSKKRKKYESMTYTKIKF